MTMLSDRLESNRKVNHMKRVKIDDHVIYVNHVESIVYIDEGITAINMASGNAFQTTKSVNEVEILIDEAL